MLKKDKIQGFLKFEQELLLILIFLFIILFSDPCSTNLFFDKDYLLTESCNP